VIISKYKYLATLDETFDARPHTHARVFGKLLSSVLFCHTSFNDDTEFEQTTLIVVIDE